MTHSRPTQSRPRLRWAVTSVAGTLLVLWALGSGYYIAFHDSMLAALLQRQAEMQYAYEDRISELRGALEQSSVQTARDGQSEESALRDLAARSLRLEMRADSLEALVGVRGGTGDLRLHAIPDTQRRADRDHADHDLGAIASRFIALETRQNAVVELARTRTERANDRIQSALAELGLAPASRPPATGGPFVPIAEGAATPSDNLALLEDALARRRRLETVTAHLPLRQPVAGPLDVTSGFGARHDPFYGRLALHTGIDLRQDYGSAVRAVAAGSVTIAGAESGYGTLVEIDHGNGYATRYAHLSVASVKVGDKVAAGTPIGQIGTSGRSTGPHLHYEVRIAGEPVDPARYLKLAGSIAAD